MCAEYMMNVAAPELKGFGVFMDDLNDPRWSEHVRPHQYGAMIHEHDGETAVRLANFSLIPDWSDTKRPKFATHNARVESAHEKPTWKKPLATQRCAIPLTHFIEPIYKGDFAGHMVKFSDKNSEHIFVAGVFNKWNDIWSYAMLTEGPRPLVAETGHHRSPIFIKPESTKEWISGGQKPYDELRDFLTKNKAKLDLQVESERTMRPGWEKRAERKRAKR